MKSPEYVHTTGARCRSFAGAWIEMLKYAKGELKDLVAPSRERGLKYCFWWIEALKYRRSFAGAWIEMIIFETTKSPHTIVAPSRERGLKSPAVQSYEQTPASLLRGSVD